MLETEIVSYPRFPLIARAGFVRSIHWLAEFTPAFFLVLT
ncbi:hypothetical protein SAMN05421638_0934 [Kaistella treverensis]|uniref:Uncharacterized protein n=1 Tax=Kaistella treverensis TaxID=631455 RepID=A0A1I3KPL5_9FLAO|nr:hypothetical protein SAMN05421638_0934 [Kaistella treverensis]